MESAVFDKTDRHREEILTTQTLGRIPGMNMSLEVRILSKEWRHSNCRTPVTSMEPGIWDSQPILPGALEFNLTFTPTLALVLSLA